MDIVFDNDNLLKLYTSGISRKYRISDDVLRKFIMRIRQIEAAATIHDLWKTPSLHFEKLSGMEMYSIRLDKKWRMELKIDWNNSEKTVGTVHIIEISVHYGD